MQLVVLMDRNVTKQVRLTKEEARRLREVARLTKTTESAVLRAGIRLTQEGLERQERRRAAFEALARMADEVPGKDARFGLR